MLRASILATLLCVALTAAAQDKTVKFIIGFPAGAGLDTMTRLVAERMRGTLGQPVIVENRPGAGGRLATELVKGSPADGSVLHMTPLVTMVTAPHVYKDLRYDPFSDFAPVAHAANFLFAYAVGPTIASRDLKEFVALVKSDAKLANYSSAAPGSIPHFIGVMFARAAGVDMTHIAYKGTANALTDLMGGQISAFVGVVSNVAAQHKAGRLRVLATTGAQRARQLPEVPTLRESGFDLEGSGWYAAYAPAGTPPEVLDRLSKALIAAVRSEDIGAKLRDLGMEPTGLGPAELAKIHRADYDKWGPVIRASGFAPND